MFEVTYGLKLIGTTNTFLEAWEMIYKKGQLDTPKTLQFLETTIWIEDKALDAIYFFWEAKEKAYKLGWQVPTKKEYKDEKQDAKAAGSDSAS